MALKRQIQHLQLEQKDHSEVLEHLCSVPESEVHEVIQRLRTTSNLSIVLQSIKGSSLTTIQPSEMKTALGIIPKTDSGIEFELNVLHSSVYPTFKPLDIDSVNLDNLFRYNTPKSPLMLSSKLQILETSNSTSNFIGKSSIMPTINIESPSPLRGIHSKRTSSVFGPVQDYQYCDSRLNHLNIAYWTTIPISNEFAACVLSNYFESYHPIFACFDPDLFLSDLVDHKLNYCSPFLLSALMSLACVTIPNFF
jgi:hypothetical protein